MFSQDAWLRQELVSTLLNTWLTEIQELLADQTEGKMFGALVGHLPNHCKLPTNVHYLDQQQGLVVIRAYSGQCCGVWHWPSWVPSLLDHVQVASESWRTQYQLHCLSHKIKALQEQVSHPALSSQELLLELSTLRQQRTQVSRQHAQTLREFTYLHNVRGESCRLSEWWPKAPTGVGECCAPKLLSYASKVGIQPLALAEFWIGATPKRPPAQMIESLKLESPQFSQIKQVDFYEPCLSRCQPILPYLLAQKTLLESPHLPS